MARKGKDRQHELHAGEKKQGKNGTAFLVGGGDKKQDNAI
jgi:hypothetical protein